MSRPTTSVPADGYGDLVVYRNDFPPKIRIERADPKIRLDALMVAGFRDVRPAWAQCTEDGVLTLTDDFGHRYIYRIDLSPGAYDPETRSFPAEWPD